MESPVVWMWALIALLAVGPGATALVLLLLRRPKQVERDAQLEELRGLSRSVVDAEMGDMRQRLVEVERGRGREREELRALREEVEGLRQGVAALLAQIRAAGLQPAWMPERSPEGAPAKGGGGGANGVVAREEGGEGVGGQESVLDLRSLQGKIARHFALEEIEDLAFQLGMDGETVWSDVATRQGRARALVQFMDRRGRLEELVALCRELRKSVRW